MAKVGPNRRVVGQTKDVGFIVGARRTFAVAPDDAWAALLSEAGIRLWLGDAADLRLEPGAPYHTGEGATGEVRVARAGSHLRLTWQPGGWPRASTIQVRVLASRDKTTIVFHQEHLPGPAEREQMLRRWHAVLDALAALLGTPAA